METTSEWIFRGVVALLLFVGWYLWLKMVSAVETMSKDHRQLDKTVSDYKLYAEERFAKADHVAESFSKISETMHTIQNALNTNTNMTGIIMERVNAVAERLKN